MVNCCEFFDCLIFRKSPKKDEEESSTSSRTDLNKTHSQRSIATKSEDVPVKKQWIQRTLDKGVSQLIDEFQDMAKWTPEGMTTEAFQANKDQNRYQDVPCQDQNRILVKFPGLKTDYIHANYLGPAHNPHRFICTQAPLENTHLAYWAMAIQEKVECIVMLCNCIEMGKIKCYQYWPVAEGEKMAFGEEENQIQVTNMGSKKMSEKEQGISVTTLKVEWAKGSRSILHYQWEDWPDRGIPNTTVTAINLLSAIRCNQYPIIVHCSAGIGRTGTVVAIEYVQDKMMAGEPFKPMNELLKELRTQRPWTIQNQYQYLYLHHVLLAHFLEDVDVLKDKDNDVKYKKWLVDYEKETTKAAG